MASVVRENASASRARALRSRDEHAGWRCAKVRGHRVDPSNQRSALVLFRIAAISHGLEHSGIQGTKRIGSVEGHRFARRGGPRRRSAFERKAYPGKTAAPQSSRSLVLVHCKSSWSTIPAASQGAVGRHRGCESWHMAQSNTAPSAILDRWKDRPGGPRKRAASSGG